MTVRFLPILLAAACGAQSTQAPSVPATGPSGIDEALLRDFHKVGKVDENGHPINAIVLEGEKVCGGPGEVVPGGYRGTSDASVVCDAKLPRLPYGDLVFNVKLRPLAVDTSSKKDVVKVSLGTSEPVSTTFTGRSFRADGQWTFIPLTANGGGEDSVHLKIETFGRGAVEIDYIEIFPNEFPIAIDPGSRVMTDDTVITIEAPRGGMPPILTINGRELGLDALVKSGEVTRADTSYRTVYTITVAQLAGGDTGDLDLFARDPNEEDPTARLHIYRTAPPCKYEGDPDGRKLLLTGFQAFPVAETHPNVSNVAVQALDPQKLVGAQVMRLTLPVEYDDAPAIVADAILRCAPDYVVDFGQGGGRISLEHVAYNLKDTGTAGDNRGRFQAGVVIADDGPATVPSGLPLDRIKAALEGMKVDEAIGQQNIEDSDDPGRYICNNTFYGAVTASAGTQVHAGFIHLPYTTDFSDAQKQAWGEIVRVVVQSIADPVPVTATSQLAE